MKSLLESSLLSTSDQPEEDFAELLDRMLSVAKAHGVDLSLQEEFHLSLSQTVVLRHHWIQPFTHSLRTSLAHCKRFVKIQSLKTFTAANVCAEHKDSTSHNSTHPSGEVAAPMLLVGRTK